MIFYLFILVTRNRKKKTHDIVLYYTKFMSLFCSMRKKIILYRDVLVLTLILGPKSYMPYTTNNKILCKIYRNCTIRKYSKVTKEKNKRNKWICDTCINNAQWWQNVF